METKQKPRALLVVYIMIKPKAWIKLDLLQGRTGSERAGSFKDCRSVGPEMLVFIHLLIMWLNSAPQKYTG